MRQEPRWRQGLVIIIKKAPPLAIERGRAVNLAKGPELLGPDSQIMNTSNFCTCAVQY